MFVMIIYCIFLTICYVCSFYFTYIERQKLINMIAAKDYADYKNFEREDKKTEYTNMFRARDERIKRFDEME